MKKKLFVVAATLCMIGITGVLAQEPAAKPATPPTPPTAEEIAQQQTERMKQCLNLTDAQAKQIQNLNLKQAQEHQALREKMAAQRQERADKMKSILTTEQFMQWSKMQGHGPHMGRGEGMRGGRPGHGAGMQACPKDCPNGCPKASQDGAPHKRRARK